MALKTIAPRLRTIDTRTCKPPPKRADAELLTPEHRAWAQEVKRRAGYRCEWVENGVRCDRASPAHRLFADHIDERRDGGAALDPKNGRCLCGSHHGLKTASERAKRMTS
ncbi:HNH endonuclease signature motif containing protein [Methylopila sp. Yamaguchi]|uniref:HNH endonuclease signature motif containing protein n=1 Tax=Methylopila sp. Yamaguchi TaxID=1437817 RepID=UPI000CBE2C50|nr:HNH endonuclease signature motif containing protein [Methylopila sp. Yamaguchi]GBD48086.1 HNH endonuclease [Methylopila sp. Yamaguchi]